MRLPLLLSIAGAMLLSSGAFAQKKPLDESVYDSWKSIQGTRLSDDGKWVFYRIVPQEGDAVLEVKSTTSDRIYKIERASAVSYAPDGKYLVATVVPKFEEMREARRKKVKAEDQPKNSLVILDLATGDVKTVDRVTSFVVPSDGNLDWVLYKPEPPKPAANPEAKKAEEPKPNPEAAKKDETPKKKSDHKAGDTVVLRNLSTGQEQSIADVVSYQFSNDGKHLVYTVSTKDGAGDGVVWMDLVSGKKTTMLQGLGRYSALSMNKDATTVAFATDRDDYAAKKPGYSVYYFDPATSKTTLLAKEGTKGVPDGWYVPANTSVRVSESGKRVVFSTVVKPPAEGPPAPPDDEKVNLDIWSWTDKTLQPQQLLQANSERNRTYEAIAYLDQGGKVVQIERPELPSVQMNNRVDLPIGLGQTSDPYDIEMSWDTGYNDVYVVDLHTGEAKRLVTKLDGQVSLSPNGKFVYIYDAAARRSSIYNLANGSTYVVSDAIKQPLYDVRNDVPGTPSSYGIGGWTKDDERVLVYDQWDVWLVDPTGASKPIDVTDGYGRAMQTTLRIVDLDPDKTYVDSSKPLLLAAMDDRTKQAGFYRDTLVGGGVPQMVIMQDRLFGNPSKAKNADIIAYTRQDFDEYPDVWLADNVGFANPRKISEANPQQKEYNWGKTELVTWTSNDGVPLQGYVIKPENFDYAKKYPMIVYFYERNSDTMHGYRSPSPTASILNPTMAVSNGYIVFIPDIVYKNGYPGESAISCIMPGVQEVVRRGYVDPKKIGIDGQSWGGYQVAYMITETDMFACAYSGAPVADMFSAYGGIRWGSGLVRAFQYEKGQSRIDASIWDKPLRFLENSPMFFLDKVQTPVLIMANDKDGSVPWYQGIEMFTDLRRLQKPAWLLVYNDEDHNLVQRKNRKDLSKRKQQFYDYYLKGAPMPMWMKEGIPAVNKGKDYGFELSGK
jgi:dipeptidyl aminopeptidase/acylaminoacyl peptidase